jgi:putative restriction endonuclease
MMATIRTSEKLTQGELYSRKQLADKFKIIDATLNTGVFQPKGHFSIWLFVTRKKLANKTQYIDSLVGDILNWQGQTSGRTDQLIIDHQDRGLELLVFYREKDHSPFRYEGIFEYVEHSGGSPTAFKLRRSAT